MARTAVAIAFVLLGASFDDVSYAGCSCRCIDGWTRASCTNAYDIPPVCSQTPCPFGRVSTTPNIAPVTGLRPTSCRSIKQCDEYGDCEWKQSCR